MNRKDLERGERLAARCIELLQRRGVGVHEVFVEDIGTLDDADSISDAELLRRVAVVLRRFADKLDDAAATEPKSLAAFVADALLGPERKPDSP